MNEQITIVGEKHDGFWEVWDDCDGGPSASDHSLANALRQLAKYYEEHETKSD